MGLKTLVRQKIMNEVIKNTENSSHGAVEWRVLVVDKFAMRMISSCCKMHQISAEGITIVEDIHKRREPLPSMEAVYLITPSEKSLQALMKDFADPNEYMYRAAHVYFTEACPEELFTKLCKAPVAKCMKTLKEINIAFIVHEEQVFSLDSPQIFQTYYNSGSTRTAERQANMERMAEQIATLCATLGEYPSVRYRMDFDKNFVFAKLVKQKLDFYKTNEPKMGEGAGKALSQLIILDRGFDCVSPLLHELTLQAMAYDLLPIENDVYKYEPFPGEPEKEVPLEDNNNMWAKFRHNHIGNVSMSISHDLKKYTKSKEMDLGEAQSLKDLTQLIKKMPQYRKEISKCYTVSSLAENCLKEYTRANVKELCLVEQNLALGTDAENEKINVQLHNMTPILTDPNAKSTDKTRIIALYILHKNGISEENFNKLVQYAEIQPHDKRALMNMTRLGINVVGNYLRTSRYPRKERIIEKFYPESRWIPVAKDIMEDCIEDKLDEKHFPYLSGRSNPSYQVAQSARYGNWHKDKAQQMMKNVPRIIFFVVGGITYSEIRCAYEVTKAVENMEVIIGSTHILTPMDFLDSLSNLEN